AFGGLMSSDESRGRELDVDVRVGDHNLDNTHPVRGDRLSFLSRDRHDSWALAYTGDPGNLRNTLWAATDDGYQDAAKSYLVVKGNVAVKAQPEDASPDFSVEEPVQFLGAPAAIECKREAWEQRLRDWSALFRRHAEILDGGVELQLTATTRYLVSSDGARIQTGREWLRLSFWGRVRADDGMELRRFDSMDVAALESLPTDSEVRVRIQKVIDDLLALRRAPVATAYIGPAILGGRAAGVFFHEVFGHRVEGHRQKDDEEGQTFVKAMNRMVMPDFMDVYDDPTAARIAGMDVNGHYQVDDEGVLSRKVDLVQGGVLKGFLMSRSPVHGFDHSNGHGRRQVGQIIVARQGNLVVHPRRVVPAAELWTRLRNEIKAQGKAYGLFFEVVEGGYTQTRRFDTQGFTVFPVMVYRVYPDGHRELVRGARLDGTPLAALTQIEAAGDDPDVFNGFCGAESGFVPVAAVSPSLLLQRVEIARTPSDADSAPILAPPGEQLRRGGP
ncbi:MAG TPA: metallopeptidase TldD-related protein, partial [Kofleriaceae bacterium]|nr:metallopeptidase TldD-related protein [Kofleriaceae bacterium]